MATKRETSRNVSARKKALLQALEKTMGNITQACKLTGIDRASFYRYLKDEAFAEKVDSVEDITFDFVESQIMRQIREGNTAVMIFFAKTKMRSRGYIERQEIDIKDRPTFMVQASQKGAMKVLKNIDEGNSKTG